MAGCSVSVATLNLYDAVHAYAAAINSMSPENFTACFAPEGTTAFFNQFVPIIEKVYLRAGRIHAAGKIQRLDGYWNPAPFIAVLIAA